jgi:hypothetical protein
MPSLAVHPRDDDFAADHGDAQGDVSGIGDQSFLMSVSAGLEVGS